MNKFIIALGLTLAASSAAMADSTALDAYQFPAKMGQVALATGATNSQIHQDKLGDGSPTFTGALAGNGVNAGVDYTATASIGSQTTIPLGVSPRAL